MPPTAPLLPFPPGTAPAPGFTRGWHVRTGPAAVIGKPFVPGEPRYGYNLPRWADHAYRYRAPGGSWVWAAEPYFERDGSFAWQADFDADKAKLEAAGYTVRIDQAEARYSPGHTLPIVITLANEV